MPRDYPIPDDPVESILQPLLAATLTESLDLAELMPPEMMVASNMAIANLEVRFLDNNDGSHEKQEPNDAERF